MVIATVAWDLAALLPETPDDTDRCVDRLMRDITEAAGVEGTHLMVAAPADPPAAPMRLCVHFDSARAAAGELRELAGRSAAELAARYGHLSRRVPADEDIDAFTVQVRTRLLPFAQLVHVTDDGARTVHVEFDRRAVTVDDLTAAMAATPTAPVDGGTAAKEGAADQGAPDTSPADESPPGADQRHQQHDHGHGGVFGERTELIFAGLSGALLLAGWVMAAFLDTPRLVEMLAYSAAFFFGAYYTVAEAWRSVRAKRFEIDFLMLVAAAGAAALGEVAEGALLLFLFSIGHALEGYAMGRARRAIEALAELTPKTALVRRGGPGAEPVEVPVAQLRIGDTVVVRPNLRLPADGFVVGGTSSVDQAPVTGESVPVDKHPVPDPTTAAGAPEQVDAASRVFAGTINGSGALEVQVTRLAADSTMARVVRLVAEAQTQTSPTQRFTDRFQRVFVPAVLGAVVLLLFAGVVIDEPFSATVYRALAVLVAASPCALAIATPSAVLSAVARAARGGILVKGGAPLEQLGRLTAIAFDKTGTLTRGTPRIADVIPAAGVAQAELLAVAVAVEDQSDHPLARAVVRDGRPRLGDTDLPQVRDVRSVTGMGVLAQIDGAQVAVGRRDLFTGSGPALSPELDAELTRLEQAGRTTMLVRSGERWLGAIGLMDLPRPEAAPVLTQLRDLGIRETIMLSGDHQRVADAVAAQVGVSRARGGLMPEDKVREIAQLQASAGAVAMVGDGVNDAPAMATASVGIAMGAAGSDVALETADVALMADDLRSLPTAVGLSRRASAIIKQNLWASLGVVAILIPATILGLGIGPAVLIHEGSTLIVVANALRLLAYRDHTR